MASQNRNSTALLFIALLAGFAHEAAAANTYRYLNDRGQTVYGSTVPPQFVKNGYEVLNENGAVIQVVPRALTEAELAEQEATRAEREAAEAEIQARIDADNLLVRLYRSPDEIARKRDERLTIIDGQMTALLSSYTKLESEVMASQLIVDNYVKSEKEPPAQSVETLRIQSEELARLTIQKDRLDADRATAVADAERDMLRLAELLGLPPPVAEALPENSNTE